VQSLQLIAFRQTRQIAVIKKFQAYQPETRQGIIIPLDITYSQRGGTICYTGIIGEASPIGPVKLDVAMPIGDAEKKNDVQFYIALGPEL